MLFETIVSIGAVFESAVLCGIPIVRCRNTFKIFKLTQNNNNVYRKKIVFAFSNLSQSIILKFLFVLR